MKRLVSILALLSFVSTLAQAGLPPTTTKGSSDSGNVTTFNTMFPGHALAHNGVTAYVPTPPAPAKNYVPNGDFESNAVTGWTLCNTTLTGVNPTGTITNTASSFNALSVSSSSPLAGTYSLSVASSAATTAGQGFCSNTFTIDADNSTSSPRIQVISGSYSGTANMNFSGTSSNTWAVYVYDVTNSAWIQPSGVYNFIGDGKIFATFQPSKTSSQYQLVFLNVNASSGAIAMKFDSFGVGPQSVVTGPAMSDPQAYTPTFTGFGTVATSNLKHHRDGAYDVIEGTFIAGTTTATEARVSLPSGETAASDYATLEQTGSISKSGGDANTYYSAQEPSTTYMVFTQNTNGGLTKINANTLGGAGNTFSINARIRVQGWSSNSVQSSDTDTRVVTWTGYSTSTQSITSSISQITGWTSVDDTHAGFSSNAYTIPVAGYYDIQGYISLSAAGANNQSYVAVYKNGSLYSTGPQNNQTASQPGSMTFSNTLKFSAGDVVTIWAWCQNSTAMTAGNATGGNRWSIKRAPGPATITASESVNMRAETPTGTPPSSMTQIVFPTVSFDSHNQYNSSTGTYTVPTPGTYRVSSNICVDGGFSAGTASEIALMKNSTGFGYYRNDQGGNFTGLCTNASATIKAVQGDTLSVKFYTAATSATYLSLANTNHGNNFCVERIGN